MLPECEQIKFCGLHAGGVSLSLAQKSYWEAQFNAWRRLTIGFIIESHTAAKAAHQQQQRERFVELRAQSLHSKETGTAADRERET
jgi:hypothetical protein